MNDRIALVIKAKNITPSQLADDLGVQRSGVSHILNNRNKPSLDFIQRLLKSFPEISTEWMLFGEGPMMKPLLGEQPQIAPEKDNDEKPSPPKPVILDLFADKDTETDVQATEIEESEPEEATEVSEEQHIEAQNNEPEASAKIGSDKNVPVSVADKQQYSDEPRPKDENIDKNREKKVDKKKPAIIKDDRLVEKIVIFYSDKTFSVYHPELDEQ